MIRVITTHWKSPRWAEPQLTSFRANTSERFQIYCFYGPQDGAPFADYYFAEEGPLEQGPNECEENKMNMLASIAMQEAVDSDLMVFVHGDTLVLPGWDSYVREKVRQYGLTAIRRTENNGEPVPHSSFCAASAAFWGRYGTWDRGTWLDNDGREVNDVGGGLYHSLLRAKLQWHPLVRVNRTNLHQVQFGLYGSGSRAYVYHHAMGLREAGMGGQLSRVDRVNPQRDQASNRRLAKYLTRLFPGATKTALRRRPQEQTAGTKLLAAIHPVIKWETEQIERNTLMSEYVYDIACYLNGRPHFQQSLEIALENWARVGPKS